MRAGCLILLAMLFYLAAGASAQTTRAVGDQAIRRDAGSTAKVSSQGPSFVRVAFSLAGVLAVIVLLFLAAKRLAPRRPSSSSPGGTLQILARTAISPKHRIVLLQIGRRILVCAEGVEGLTTLSEITDATEAAALIQQLQSEKPGGSFASALSGAMDRFRAAEKAPPTELDSIQQEIDGISQKVRGMAR